MKEELKVERRESCLWLMDINSVEKDVSYRGRRAEALLSEASPFILTVSGLFCQPSARSCTRASLPPPPVFVSADSKVVRT